MIHGKLSVAMVSDYFYPNIGGIETHIEQLAINLTSLGYHVIVITHKYTKPGLKRLNNIPVYYLNIPTIAMNTTFPNLLSNFYTLKRIFDKERIDIVHGHQTMSNLALEAVFHAQTMGLKTCFTEHSVFEVGGLENIIVNKLAELILRGTDRFICVSYTSKHNLMERLNLESKDIHVIPNAVIREVFYKKTKENHENAKELIDCDSIDVCGSNDTVLQADKQKITIVVASRLVSRKGIDILIEVVPQMCLLHNNVEFVIAGDGPKRDELEQMADMHNIKSKVRMIGEIEHAKVAEVLRSGDIFLNVSLTEAFCMAILEAASCGLYIVSTNVGGVSEVLPQKCIVLTGITKDEIIKGLNVCIAKLSRDRNDINKKVLSKKWTKKDDSDDLEAILKNVYNWDNIAKRTLTLYKGINTNNVTYKERIKKYNFVTEFVCRLFLFAEYMQCKILQWICK